MASTPAVYPASHEEALERVMRVIELIAARPDIADEEVVAALVRDGIPEVDAELLIRFVPCALSFALLKHMGLNKFPSTYQVQNSAGRWVAFPLAAEHYFSSALGVGYEVTTHGYTERVNKEAFQAVVMRSAEMNAVNQYFGSGGTREGLAGGTLAPPTFIGITAEQIAASRRVAEPGATPVPRRPLWIAAGLAACGYAPLCAHCWARPRDAESLGSLLVGLLLVSLPAIGAFLLGLARRGYLRLGLPFLLLALVGSVPAVGAAAGGWPGGWALGVAGAILGALMGIASGWLVMRWVLLAAPGFRSPGPPGGGGVAQ